MTLRLLNSGLGHCHQHIFIPEDLCEVLRNMVGFDRDLNRQREYSNIGSHGKEGRKSFHKRVVNALVPRIGASKMSADRMQY